MGLNLSHIAAEFSDEKLSSDPGRRLYQRLVEFIEGDHQTKHQEPREPGFHISGLSRICARQAAMMQALDHYPAGAVLESEHMTRLWRASGKELPREVEYDVVDRAGSVKTQDHGSALHRWFQREYLGVSQVLWGHWYCAGCDKVHEGFMPLSCECGRHWRDAISYREWTLRYEIGGLSFSGHVDGIWVDPDWGWENRTVAEMKSLSSYKYDNLTRPIFPHVVQTHGYMKGLGLDKAILIYIDRGKDCEWSFKGGLPISGPIRIKTFTIYFSESLWDTLESTVADYKTVLELIANKPEHFEGRDLEDIAGEWEAVCDIKTCDAAKACPVRDECFELDV